MSIKQFIIQNNIIEEMLPSLKQSQAKNNQAQQSRVQQKMPSVLASSKASKGVEQALYYEDKYQNQLLLNRKLKKLVSSMKSNNETSESVNEQENQVLELVKQKRKLESNVQYQAHALNILISENSKLKQQVDAQRNKRAIYFNIYKNLQHEIHLWESKYKNVLIESLKSEGAITKIKQKFRKATRKLQKDVQALAEQIQNINKNELQNKKQQNKQTKHKNSKQGTTLDLKQKQEQEGRENKIYLTSTQQLQKQIQPSVNNGALNRKSLDNELEYEIQEKSIIIQGVFNRIRQICGTNDIHQCFKIANNLEEQIEYHFSLFKEEEKRQKQLAQKQHMLQKQLDKIEDENFQRKSTKVTKIENKNQIQSYNEKIREMEKKLQAKIGIKVSDLSNEMLLHHCLRVRDEKRQGKKNLQKYLEQTKKQKPECSLLLSPKQMHKKVIQSQALN